MYRLNPEKVLLELMRKRKVIYYDSDKPPNFPDDEYVLLAANRIYRRKTKNFEKKYGDLDEVPDEILKKVFEEMKEKSSRGAQWYLDKIDYKRAKKIGEECGLEYKKN